MKTILALILLFTIVVLLPGCSRSTSPAPPVANVTCNELSLYLDPVLGSGLQCETVPENNSSDIPMDIFIYPAHTELTIQDYPLTGTQFPAWIGIYPVDRFSELLPDLLPRRVFDLQGFIASGTWISGELPFLPPLPMAQTLFSQEAVLSFHGGKGARFITHYNESSNPIDNRTIFYTFQGLTDDGMTWVTVTLPIRSPILPDDSDFPPPPDGFTDESWFQNYDTYIGDMKDALDAQPPESFFPTLFLLDGLVRNLTIGH
jgi:hypothetical protein